MRRPDTEPTVDMSSCGLFDWGAMPMMKIEKPSAKHMSPLPAITTRQFFLRIPRPIKFGRPALWHGARRRKTAVRGATGSLPQCGHSVIDPPPNDHALHETDGWQSGLSHRTRNAEYGNVP